MEDGGKTIELPKMVITARRVSALELEVILRKITLVWNANTLSFDRFESEPDVQLVQVEGEEPVPEPPVKKTLVSADETAQTIVAGQWVVSITFNYSDDTSESHNFIVSEGRYWFKHFNGSWYSRPNFLLGSNWTQESSGPTQANITPPEGSGGGDDGEIIGAN